MKKFFTAFILHSLVILFGATMVLNAQLTVDEDGWSVITSSDDTRTIYVSSSEGDDSNSGLTIDSPVKSISKAKTLARDGYPDHILFKRGDTWSDQYGFGSLMSGRSAEEPMVIGYYGDSGDRPLMMLNGNLFYNYQKTRSNLVFVGLEFYNPKHDPNSSEYSVGSSIGAIGWEAGYGENILVEDCVFRFIFLGPFYSEVSGNLKNVKLRRNIVVDSWKENSFIDGNARVMGVYIDGVEGLLLEENFFDHNGWNEDVPDAGANMFNHNVYIQCSCPNPDLLYVNGNIFARGSSHGLHHRSGGHCDNNLFIQNAISLQVGYNLGDRYAYMKEWVTDPNINTITNNVIQEVRTMDKVDNSYPRSAAAWGINPIIYPSIIKNNIASNYLNEGAAFGTYEDINELGGSVSYENNLHYRAEDLEEDPDPLWLDPDRTVGHYNQTLGGEASTIDFLLEARKRPINTWWPEYSAEVVNDYIRLGFSEQTDNTPPEAVENLVAYEVEGESVWLKWDWAMDDVRTVGYNVYVNDVLYNSSLYEKDSILILNLTAATEYEFRVESVDVGSNVSDEDAIVSVTTLSADITPPSVPQNITATEITGSSISFVWDASSDDRTLLGYNVYVDGSKENAELLVTTDFLLENLESYEQISFQVSAVDAAYNESELSSGLNVRTLDIIAPDVVENLAYDFPDANSVSFTWDESSDNAGVDHYVFYVDGDEHGTPAENNYQITGLDENASFNASVSAVDAAGNTSRRTQPISITLGQTSIEGKVASQIMLYPNPSSGNLTIESPNEMKKVEIFSVSGRLEHIEEFEDGSHEVTINISMLDDGVYMIQCQTEEAIVTKSIVKK